MNELSDQELLRDYVERHSEAAFAELTRRHVDLVYSASLRMVGDSHLAKDVAQHTFIALAQNAARLTDRLVLSGWLHRTAQNLAGKIVRTDVRRRAREQEAAAMNELLSATPDAPWEHIALNLDAALGELNEPDRDAVLLRYFERKSAREMAGILGVSDEAAQKRVSRAIERLREIIASRGVAVGASGLAVVISANAVQAAPAGLALAISAAATAAGAMTATATATVGKVIAMTTLQKTIVGATVAALAGVAIFQAHQGSELRKHIRTSEEQRLRLASSNEAAFAALQNRADQLAAQNLEISQALAQANREKARLEAESKQARHTAAVFKELADLAQSSQSTNAYASERQVMVEMGKQARLFAQLNKPEGELSPQEKMANDARLMDLAGEMLKLLKAAQQFSDGKASQLNSAESDIADTISCLLYGAVDLNEQQFGDIYGMVQEFKRRKEGIKENSEDKEAAFRELAERAKSDVRGVLTPEQVKIFDELLPYVKYTENSFDVNFMVGRPPGR